MGSISTSCDRHRVRMPWYEYEPLLTYGCTRSRPGVQVGQASHPYSSYDSSSHSGTLFYPTYESYISGMVENDFFFIGYKQMPEPPRLKLRCIESVPWKVHFRWTNPK